MRYTTIFTLLITGLYTVLLPAQMPNNRYITPDLHGENISGLFLRSPFSMQYHQALDSHQVTAISACQRRWNTATASWGDTVAVFQQTIEQQPGSTVATETYWKKNANSFTPVRKIVICNPSHWVWSIKQSPDSTFIYDWSPLNNNWSIKKRIIYRKSDTYVYQREVFMDGHTTADSIWRYDIPYLGKVISTRSAISPLGGAYEITDSLFFSAYNFDTLISVMTHRKKMPDGLFERYRRHDYTHHSGPYNPYVAKVFRNDETYSAWTFLYQYLRIVDFQHFVIATEKDTFILNVGYLPNVGSEWTQYDSLWNPLTGAQHYYSTASGNPDSTLQLTYFRNATTGIMERIEYKIKYGVNSTPQYRYQWIFSCNNLPLPVHERPEQSSKYFQVIGTGPDTRKVLILYGDDDSEKKLLIYNFAGVLQYEATFTGKEHSFPVHRLARGTCVATIVSPAGRYSKQFSYTY